MENEQNHSPVIDDVEFTFNFPNAMQHLIEGKKVTRKSWENKQHWGELHQGWLSLHKEDGYHTWMVNDGDLLGEDWVIV